MPPDGLLVIALPQSHQHEHRTAEVGFVQEDFLKNTGNGINTYYKVVIS
jgi:hypothetical protein